MNRPDASKLLRPAALALALAGALAAVPAEAASPRRCSIDLQRDVCLEANPVCPAFAGPRGISAGSWPVFQHDAQHTGKSQFSGPSCSNVLWQRKLQGKLLSAPTLVAGGAGQPESLFVPVGKAPICSLDPTDGSLHWCGTDNQGKLVDRSSPVVGNGGFLYVGTRDNDLWAIDLPGNPATKPPVAWRQKVCTDGDITTSPLIGPDGTVYMGSDSLGAGTLVAMCPGESRQPKWCINPVGGGIRNTSPALSPAGDRVYVTIGAGALGAFDPNTGAELWRVRVERQGSTNRAPNYTPVVHPTTGLIYLGTRSGLWEITPGPSGGTARLLFDTGAEKMYAPPALDAARGTLVFGASRGTTSTLYAIGLDGSLKWKQSGLHGAFKNTPPVIDADGRVYFALGTRLAALSPAGATLWSLNGGPRYTSSPILGDGVLYVGTTNALVIAVGGCA